MNNLLNGIEAKPKPPLPKPRLRKTAGKSLTMDVGRRVVQGSSTKGMPTKMVRVRYKYIHLS